MHTVQENIKRIRKENGLTQKELAEKSGLSEVAIRQYEGGKRNPKAENITKLADALNCKPSDIFPNLVSFDVSSENIIKEIKTRINRYEKSEKVAALEKDYEKAILFRERTNELIDLLDVFGRLDNDEGG